MPFGRSTKPGRPSVTARRETHTPRAVRRMARGVFALEGASTARASVLRAYDFFADRAGDFLAVFFFVFAAFAA